MSLRHAVIVTVLSWAAHFGVVRGRNMRLRIAGKLLLTALSVLPVALATSGCSVPTPALAGAVVENGTLQVSVVDSVSGAPLSGTTVRAVNQAEVADSQGSLIFKTIQTGDTLITVTRPGFATYAASVRIAKDVETTVRVSLTALSAPARYDLVVVGAGTGGVAAAIQARRMGLKVALLEESDWIGGQLTAAAVTSLDEGPAPVSRSGLYKEFVGQVNSYYASLGKSTGTAYYLATSTSFEPSVGQKILYSMIAKGEQPGQALDLFLGVRVASAILNGTTVGGVVLAGGEQLSSRIVIDASEYGDFLPQAGARYRVGNTTSDAVDLSAKLNPITYTAVIRKYAAVDPLLATNSVPPGYSDALYCLRNWVTLDGTGGDGWYSGGGIDYTKPLSFAFQNAWRGMPDSGNPSNYDAGSDHYREITKTSIDAFQNDYPVTARYLEDRTFRKSEECNAKLKTLQVLYYFQHELGQNLWSVANDEGFDTPYNRSANVCADHAGDLQQIEAYFPVLPYVRESRRVIGLMTLTADDIRRNGQVAFKYFPSALAVGDYPIDLHGATDDSDLDCGDRSSDIIGNWSQAGGTFQVPFEAFIPESIDGLLVAEKNLSTSRLASGATRLQPITMMTGQAAGALAALAVQKGVQPRNVRPLDVQLRLLDAGCVLSLYDPTDVAQDHPYWKDIQLAQLYAIFGSGTTPRTFQADAPINLTDLEYSIRNNAFRLALSGTAQAVPATRADLVRMLSSALGAGPVTAPTRFFDVPASLPLAGALNYLDALGVIPLQMVSDGNFYPDRAATRGEAAALIMRTLVATGGVVFDTPLLSSDSVLPTGSIAFAASGPAIRTIDATLLLSAVDSNGAVVADMQFGNDASSWGAWEPFAAQRSYPLPPGDGPKTVSVRFRDKNFNVSAVYSARIILDTTGPVGTIVIDNGAASTTTAAVVLSLTASDPSGVSAMQFSKDDSSWFAWEPFSSTRSAVLLPGSGTRYVYVRYRDSLGNVSQVFPSSIILAP